VHSTNHDRLSQRQDRNSSAKPVRPPLVAFIRLLGPHLSAARSAVSRILTETPPTRGYQLLPGCSRPILFDTSLLSHCGNIMAPNVGPFRYCARRAHFFDRCPRPGWHQEPFPSLEEEVKKKTPRVSCCPSCPTCPAPGRSRTSPLEGEEPQHHNIGITAAPAPAGVQAASIAVSGRRLSLQPAQTSPSRSW
jgi:hypothetical protein